jgi:hypothetical protein
MFLLSLEVGGEQLGLHNIGQDIKFYHKIQLQFKSFELYYKQLEAYNKL